MMTGNHFDKARSYYELAVDLSNSKDQKNQRKTYMKAFTDCFVTEARQLKTAGMSAMIVGDRYSKAIEACRRHGGLRELIDELHSEMNDVQKRCSR